MSHLPWRYLLLILIWGVLLACGWTFTTDRFLSVDKQQFIQKARLEVQRHKDFSSSFHSLWKIFSSYTHLYMYHQEELAEDYATFWSSAQGILSTIATQHKALQVFQQRIPIGDPLRTATERDFRVSLLFLSPFGKRRDPITNQWGFHTGIDFEAREGDSVFATADGVVVSSNENPDYGRNIQIEHSFGFQTLYAHLSKVEPSIVVGKSIHKGEKLGVVGHTGRATGLHLHYEVRNQNLVLDPSEYLEWGKILT